ncbi:MAG: hypothetical protein H6701_06310 [Myxococcales bacterium]|nr:hypothetical protein [Myxococcales bacterium]MCB9550381.1 hypothetical protein [Myxococcales bacterium]
MVLFAAILKDYRHVEDVLLGFVEAGVTGATVIEGRGMGQLIGQIPIFAGLRGMFPGSAGDSHIVIAVMDAARARAADRLVEKIAGPLDQPGTGITFTIPLGTVRGLGESPG